MRTFLCEEMQARGGLGGYVPSADRPRPSVRPFVSSLVRHYCSTALKSAFSCDTALRQDFSVLAIAVQLSVFITH